jgi:hypothetical protein
MDTKKAKRTPPKPIRWDDAEWAWLAEVAKSVGLTRSGFIKFAAHSMARATQAGLPAYSVGVAIATPQNTRPNQFDLINRQIEGGELGGERSRTRSETESLSGINAEHLGREGGGNPTNGARPKAVQAKVSRS